RPRAAHAPHRVPGPQGGVRLAGPGPAGRARPRPPAARGDDDRGRPRRRGGERPGSPRPRHRRDHRDRAPARLPPRLPGAGAAPHRPTEEAMTDPTSAAGPAWPASSTRYKVGVAIALAAAAGALLLAVTRTNTDNDDPVHVSARPEVIERL